MESLAKLRTLLIVTCVFWLGVVLIWAATDMTVVRAAAAILALISTTSIWSVWALNEYGINIDGTPREQEKAKRVADHDEDARLGLLLALLTPDEREALRTRITEGLNAEGEVVSLADLLEEQAPHDVYERQA